MVYKNAMLSSTEEKKNLKIKHINQYSIFEH